MRVKNILKKTLNNSNKMSGFWDKEDYIDREMNELRKMRELRRNEEEKKMKEYEKRKAYQKLWRDNHKDYHKNYYQLKKIKIDCIS